MILDISSISSGLPGLTPTLGSHLYEACVVCLSRSNHLPNQTQISLQGLEENTYTLNWNIIYDDQMDRAWADQEVATEHGAICLGILFILKLTNFTVIERSIKKTGFDYWLGEKNDDDDILFQKKARLEISGLFAGTQSQIRQRYNDKKKQTERSDYTMLPAYVGIVEFGTPFAKIGKKP